MNTAAVISAGLSEHPESGAELMRILVDQAWAVGGERARWTWVWAERTCPEPVCGETLTWDHRHVWLRGARYRKPEYDSNPDVLLR